MHRVSVLFHVMVTFVLRLMLMLIVRVRFSFVVLLGLGLGLAFLLCKGLGLVLGGLAVRP